MGDYGAKEVHDWILYAIVCNCGLRYIGKTGYRRPLQRWHNHHHHMKTGVHVNKLMQAHYNKFGEGHFEYEELAQYKKLTTDDAKRHEYDLICKFKSYSPEHGFNINHVIINSVILPWPEAGNEHARWDLSDEQMAAHSKRMIERNKTQWNDPVFREKNAAGWARHSADPIRVAATRKKKSKLMKEVWANAKLNPSSSNYKITTRCSVDGCDDKHKCRGYCPHHYHRFRMYGDPLQGPKKTKKTIRGCSIDGCSLEHRAKGLCVIHYNRIRRKERKRNKQ